MRSLHDTPGRLIAMAGLLLVAGCPPFTPQPLPPVEPTAEVEPNDDPATAQDATGREALRFLGTIGTSEDVDVYELGTMSAGDRIQVELLLPDPGFSAALAIFDSDSAKELATLIAVANAPTTTTTIGLDPILRHNSERCFVAVAPAFGAFEQTGSYDLTIRIEHGHPVPQPQMQTLLLDFAGGNVPTRSGITIPMNAFEATQIDAALAGQTTAIQSRIIDTVRENYAGFNVEIRTSDDPAGPPTPPYSTVFFGTSELGAAIVGNEGLGVAPDGVDAYNQHPDDNAIVIVDKFKSQLQRIGAPVTAESIGLAIGNLAAHEAGHLFGLNHIYDPAELMNTFDAPGTLLLDQRFKRAVVHFSIFPDFGGLLTQDARLLLQETVGRTPRTAEQTIPVGRTPLKLATGDFDKDGDIDLAVANRFSNDVSILLNDGHGTFTEGKRIGIGAGPISIAAADFEGDGDLDLLTANPGSQSLTLLSNNGAGVFAATSTLSAGTFPRAVATGDLDGDGDLDAAIPNYGSDDVSVLLNKGNGAFAPAVNYSVGMAPQAVAASDLNGDGKLDLVTADSGSNTVSVLLNQGNGVFAAAIALTAGLLPMDVAAADLNGDGRNDLAVPDVLASLFAVQFSSNVSLLANSGMGGFADATFALVGASPQSVAAADLNGDGHMDLAVANNGHPFGNQDAGYVSLLLNKGDGSFAQDIVLDAGRRPIAVAVADFNADGHPDLAVANQDSDDVSVFLLAW